MWIRVEGGGVRQCGEGFLYVFAFFNAYFVVFGLFLPKTEKKTTGQRPINLAKTKGVRINPK